jgi:hypothetical protein
LFDLRVAGTVWTEREPIRKKKSVVGDVRVQIGRLHLNRRPMLTDNGSHRRDGLADAASQKLLSLLVGGVAFLGHLALRALDIARRSPEKETADPRYLSLVELRRRGLPVGGLGSLGALALPGPAAEHLVRVTTSL